MEKLISKLQTLFDAAWDENMKGNGTDITRMVTTFIPDAIQAIGAEQKWTPVTERLPKNDEFVLVLTRRQKYALCTFCANFYDDKDQFVLETYHGFVPRPVTHWMPLPEPPKEVEG